MLLRYDPFLSLRDLDRSLDDAFRGMTRDLGVPLGTSPAGLGAMDVRRTDDTLTVTVDLPGVNRDSIEVTFEKGVLTVAAERVRPDGPAAMAERPFGSWRRTVTVGDDWDADRAHADYTDGVLTVTVPLAEGRGPRRIEIGGSARELSSAG